MLTGSRVLRGKYCSFSQTLVCKLNKIKCWLLSDTRHKLRIADQSEKEEGVTTTPQNYSAKLWRSSIEQKLKRVNDIKEKK